MLPAFLQEAGRAGRDGCAAVVVACVERLGEGPPRLPRQRTPQAEQLALRPPWLEKGPRLCPRRGPAPQKPNPHHPRSSAFPCSPVRPDPRQAWRHTQVGHRGGARGHEPRGVAGRLRAGVGRGWPTAGRRRSCRAEGHQPKSAAASAAAAAIGHRPRRARRPSARPHPSRPHRPPAPLSPTAPALGCRRAARTAGGGAGGAVEPRRARLGVGAPDHRGAAGAWRHRPAGRRCRRRRRRRRHRSRAGWPAGASAPPRGHGSRVATHTPTPLRRRSTCSRFPQPATGRCTPRCRMR